MIVNVIKQPGAKLSAASEMDEERLNKLKNGEEYALTISVPRNPKFHRKVMAFFRFCFNYWRDDRGITCELKQFDVFREHLTVLAGFYEHYTNINGGIRVEASSLSYSNMSEDEFTMFYSALINAAMKNIFKGCGKEIEDQLMGFF